jgi:hypothetical protein
LDLMIADPELAALVGSEARLRRRWGDAWDVVGRRLFQLQACPTPDDAIELADAHVVKKRGDHVFEFPDGIRVIATCGASAGRWSAVINTLEWEAIS